MLLQIQGRPDVRDEVRTCDHHVTARLIDGGEREGSDSSILYVVKRKRRKRLKFKDDEGDWNK